MAWSGGGVGVRTDGAGHLLAEGPGASHFLSLNYFQGLGVKQAANNANHGDTVAMANAYQECTLGLALV